MDYQIRSLIKELSSSPLIKSSILKSIINSEKVYIHPRQLEVAIQEYESNVDFKDLNRAISFGDYIKIKKLYQFPEYIKFLEDFELFCGEKKEDKELVIIPLGIIFFDNYKNKIKYTGRHSAVTLINLKTKIIYIVDSDNEETIKNDITYNESKYDYYIKRKVKACVECIYGDKFRIKIVDTKAPQFLTKDIYCIFWSFMIAELIANHYNKTNKISPSIILKNITKEYNTKKKLNFLIQEYIKKIYNLFETI